MLFILLREVYMQNEKTTNYVHNKLLYEVVLIWKTLTLGNPSKKVKIPDRVALDISKISHNMARRYNFNGYSQDWKEEMIQDGIEVSIAGIKNFNELQYNNVFGYVSRACFRAFLQRMAKEKRETATKYKFFIESIQDEMIPEMTRGVDEEFYQDISNKLSAYESPKKAVEQVDVIQPLEAFFSYN